MKQLAKRLVDCDLARNCNTLPVGDNFINSPFWFRVTPQKPHEHFTVGGNGARQRHVSQRAHWIGKQVACRIGPDNRRGHNRFVEFMELIDHLASFSNSRRKAAYFSNMERCKNRLTDCNDSTMERQETIENSVDALQRPKRRLLHCSHLL